MRRTVTVTGTNLELFEDGPKEGNGRPLLFLHPGEGLFPDRDWFARLGRSVAAIALLGTLEALATAHTSAADVRLKTLWLSARLSG